jgi:Transglycosylase SLT domain
MPPPSDLLALARATAAKHALDPALVCAVVEQESAWDAHAMRYEPGFRSRYVAPLGLPPTEEVARSISWGLMQVMGQVAREHGFAGKFLSALCDPATGLDIGCAVLAAKLSAATEHASTSAGPVEGPGFSPANGDRREAPSSLPQAVAEAAVPQRPPALPAIEVVARALDLWNGGANADYASQVLARLASYK